MANDKQQQVLNNQPGDSRAGNTFGNADYKQSQGGQTGQKQEGRNNQSDKSSLGQYDKQTQKDDKGTGIGDDFSPSGNKTPYADDVE